MTPYVSTLVPAQAYFFIELKGSRTLWMHRISLASKLWMCNVIFRSFYVIKSFVKQILAQNVLKTKKLNQFNEPTTFCNAN